MKKHYQNQGGSGDGCQDNGNFSDYALLRKLFPHHDKTVLLDSLLSCDGSTVAAIQYLLTNNIGVKNNGQVNTHAESNPNFASRQDETINIKSSANSRNTEKKDLSLVSPPINFNSIKRATARRRSFEVNTPPPPPSLSLHGNSNSQIPDISPPILHHGSPAHPRTLDPLPHAPHNPNLNFPAAKFSSYAAAHAQQFYAQAHHRYLAAAAAAAASAIQQAHPHGVGHQINNSPNPLILQPNINTIGQGGFFSGGLLGRPDFAQYLSNAAVAQHQISSSNRIGSNGGIASPNSNHPALPASNLLLNQSTGIPPMFQNNPNSGWFYNIVI